VPIPRYTHFRRTGSGSDQHKQRPRTHSATTLAAVKCYQYSGAHEQGILKDQYFLRPTKTDPNWGKLTTPAARHRIAMVRAAKKLQASGFPIGFIRASSGRAQGCPIYFYRTDSVESRKRAEFLTNPRQTLSA
jgi:hypothetical protein